MPCSFAGSLQLLDSSGYTSVNYLDWKLPDKSLAKPPYRILFLEFLGFLPLRTRFLLTFYTTSGVQALETQPPQS